MITAWPLLLTRADAARYLSYTRVQFNALVAAGVYPPGRERLPGVTRWNREDLDAIERSRDRIEADAKNQAKERARQTLANYEPKIHRTNQRSVR